MAVAKILEVIEGDKVVGYVSEGGKFYPSDQVARAKFLIAISGMDPARCITGEGMIEEMERAGLYNPDNFDAFLRKAAFILGDDNLRAILEG